MIPLLTVYIKESLYKLRAVIPAKAITRGDDIFGVP